MEYARRTIDREAVFEGAGLHTGRKVRVSVHPGEDGIGFSCGGRRVSARPENVTSVDRRTQLGDIWTVEHLMSAFAGLEITDAEVGLSAPELPSMDGSARPYVIGLVEAGFAELGRRDVRLPDRAIRVSLGDAEVEISAGAGLWKYTFRSPDWWPFEQVAESADIVADYPNEVSPARTWCFEWEIEHAKRRGYGGGLDRQSLVVLGPTGYLSEPRFPNEAARHKLLDLIGDLYLAGVPIRFLDVSATRSGHKAHVMAAKQLADAASPA